MLEEQTKNPCVYLGWFLESNALLVCLLDFGSSQQLTQGDFSCLPPYSKSIDETNNAILRVMIKLEFSAKILNSEKVSTKFGLRISSQQICQWNLF